MTSHPMNGTDNFHGFKTEPGENRVPDAEALRRKLVVAVNEAEVSAVGKLPKDHRHSTLLKRGG